MNESGRGVDSNRASRRWFVLTGAFVGSFAASAPEIEAATDFGRMGFGVAIALGIALGGLVNTLIERWVQRWGVSRCLVIFGRGWLRLVVATALAAWLVPILLVPMLLAVFVALAGVDVAMNLAATEALGRQPRRLMMFNTWFNVGAAVGAGGVVLVTVTHGSWIVVWLSVGVLGFVKSASLKGLPPPPRHRVKVAPDGKSSPMPGVTRRRVVALSVSLGSAGVVGAGLDVWGVAFLREDADLTASGGAWAIILAQGLAVGARAMMAVAVEYIRLRSAVAVAALVVMAGLGAAVTLPSGVAPALALAASVGALSCIWPLVLLGAHRVGGGAAGMGVVSASGQWGRVIGPPMVAFVAATGGLGAGMTALCGAAIMLVLTAQVGFQGAADSGRSTGVEKIS